MCGIFKGHGASYFHFTDLQNIGAGRALSPSSYDFISPGSFQ